jgi:hypothetical protein
MIDYAEVLADLEAREKRLQSVIQSIRELMELPAAAPTPAVAKPEVKPNKKRAAVKRGSAPVQTATGKPLSIRDAIRHVTAEHPDTSIAITDRVLKILPEANRNSISAQIGQLVTEGQLRKDDRLIVHLAANGTHAGAAGARA